MFSRDSSLHPPEDQHPDMTVYIEECFNDFIEESQLCSGFLCQWNEEQNDITPIVTNKIPISPFKGTKKQSLTNFIEECLKSYPRPHSHSIKKHKLWSDIEAFMNIKTWQPRALFVPAFIGDRDFVVICFSEQEIEVTDDILKGVSTVIQVAGFVLSAQDLKNRARIMDIYVREIGHDIASSVQAIIAKLRNISTGLVQGYVAIDKIRQAEEEIMATYRIADTLGITVDPDYNIGHGKRFDANSSIQEVVKLCSSEAEERHIELRTEISDAIIDIWGDYKAIQSALMQLLLNAIKYARGSSYITIRIRESPDSVEYSITDIGMPLNPEDELYIWDFGWRGNRAKELHVNGSGIGLYTVKKVILAHGGSVSVRTAGEHNEIVTFTIRIPKEKKMSRCPIKIKAEYV